MRKAIIMLLASGCFASVTAWGRSFALDLRASEPSRSASGSRRPLRGNVAVLSDGDEAPLRKGVLETGRADVGPIAVGDELTLTLFDDVVITLTLTRKMPSPMGGDVFLAEASGYDGVKNAVVLRTADGLTVDVQDYHSNKVYKVISSASGVSRVPLVRTLT